MFLLLSWLFMWLLSVRLLPPSCFDWGALQTACAGVATVYALISKIERKKTKTHRRCAGAGPPPGGFSLVGLSAGSLSLSPPFFLSRAATYATVPFAFYGPLVICPERLRSLFACSWLGHVPSLHLRPAVFLR